MWYIYCLVCALYMQARNTGVSFVVCEYLMHQTHLWHVTHIDGGKSVSVSYDMCNLEYVLGETNAFHFTKPEMLASFP